MAELVINEEDAKRLYPTADKKMKEILEQTFGKETFNGNIMDRIKNMSDIYEEMGIKEAEFKNNITYRAEKMAEFAKRLGIEDSDIEEGLPCFLIRDFEIYAISHVLNEGWKPNYSDTNQRKWYPYFSVSSGFDFDGSVYDCSNACTIGGFRLCLKSGKLADFAGKTFPKEYKKFTINK